MDNKIIVVLLIATVIISVFSLIVTLSFNTESIQAASSNVINVPDASSGEVGLIIEPTLKNQNG